MLDKILMMLLSRNEIGLSLTIALALIIYFYIHNNIKDIKDVKQDVSKVQDRLSETRNLLTNINANVSEIGSKLSVFESRLDKLESRVDKTDDIILSLSMTSGKLPKLGNGHKKLFAKLITVISKSISDSYDYISRSTFMLWMDSQFPKDITDFDDTFKQLIQNIKAIQEHAVEILPASVNNIDVRAATLNFLRNCLNNLYPEYKRLGTVIKDLLITARQTQPKAKTEVVELIFHLMGEAQTQEIQVFADELSHAFTDAIKEELSSGKQFIEVFINKVNDENFLEGLCDKITLLLAKLELQINDTIKYLKNGKTLKESISLITKTKKKKSTRKKSSTVQD